MLSLSSARALIARACGQQQELQACIRCMCVSSSAACSTPSTPSTSNTDATYSGTSASTRAQEATFAALSRKGRFYDTVSVERAPSAGGGAEGWQIKLGDRYAVKTPAQHLLLLPSYALALAVAAEWEWLVRVALLGSLCARCARARCARARRRFAAAAAAVSNDNHNAHTQHNRSAASRSRTRCR